jgi:hypothetical protein
VKLSLTTVEGEVLADESLPARVGPNCAAMIGEFALAAARGREREVYLHGELHPAQELSAPGLTNLIFLAEPKELRLPEPRLSVEVEEGDEGHFRLKLSADALAPYLWLRLAGDQEPHPLCVLEDNFFHLLPGRVRTVKLRRSEALDTAEAVRARLALRSLRPSVT